MEEYNEEGVPVASGFANKQLTFSYEMQQTPQMKKLPPQGPPPEIPPAASPAGRAAPEKDIPTGVKIISIIYYINTLLIVIVAILVIINLIKNLRMPGYGSPISIFIIQLAILAIFLVFFLFIARGLWKGQKWSRITTIVLSVLTLVFFIVVMIMGSFIFKSLGIGKNQMTLFGLVLFVSIAINAIIGGYLIFSEGAKEAFK